jgi:putative membrane protein
VWRAAGVGRGVSRRQVVCYTSGIASLAIAFSAPLDALADRLFAAHMVQHLILMLVAPPLFVFGAPQIAYAWAAPRRWRQIMRVPTIGPVPAFIAQTVAMWWWHLPGPYQAALDHEAIHVLEHLSFLGTSAVLWWGVKRWSGPTAALVLTLTLMQSGALGALLQFANTPWYRVHTLADQQLAGLFMSVPAGIVYIGAAVATLYSGLSSAHASSIPHPPPDRGRGLLSGSGAKY